MKMLRAARWYARHGFAVFPLYHAMAVGECACPKGKSCPRIGKHPRCTNGLTDATTDESAIAEWWGHWPDASIGLRTGGGFGVLDIDPGKDGDETLCVLERKYGALPDTVEVITGGGGRHLFFQVSGPFQSTVARLGPGIDTRGDGGYVVAVPSVHGSGRAYAYDAARRLDEMAMAEAPAWLLDLANAATHQKAKALAEPTADIAEGERNRSMFAVAGALRRIGLSEPAIHAALLVTNSERCKPPLDEEEIGKISTSIAKYDKTTDAARDPGSHWEAPCPD